jgi:hypothetical protein
LDPEHRVLFLAPDERSKEVYEMEVLIVEKE